MSCYDCFSLPRRGKLRLLMIGLLAVGNLFAQVVQAASISPDLRALHVLNRLGFGPRPGDIAHVQAVGIDQSIEEQLSPSTIPLPSHLTEQLRTLATLQQSPAQLLWAYGPPVGGQPRTPEALRAQRLRARLVLEEAMQARLLRALESPRQLEEVMVDFWFNHFNVFAGKGLDSLWIGAYEEQAIRPYALGHFRQLLEATATHAAMLFYLDNWLNTAPGSPGARGRFMGLNENYAREVMELHTVGVNGGYTQQDVVTLARILTGWGLRTGRGAERPRRSTLSAPDPSLFFFDAHRHDFGEKVFLGHTIKSRGKAEGDEALDLLARSPATAWQLSYALAQYFVADQPSAALVQRLAERFQSTDGDIRAVLATLFHSPEFWDQQTYAAKFKTPYQYVLSAVRATGLPVDNVTPLVHALQQLGMPLYGCVSPDGYKNTQEAWLNPDAMVHRVTFATALASGRLPLTQPLAKFPTIGEVKAEQTSASPPGLVHPEPVSAVALADTLDHRFSPQTEAAVHAASPALRAALFLGSADFMKR
jgi:uncharacterized protein (DUF1800 family)